MSLSAVECMSAPHRLTRPESTSTYYSSKPVLRILPINASSLTLRGQACSAAEPKKQILLMQNNDTTWWWWIVRSCTTQAQPVYGGHTDDTNPCGTTVAASLGDHSSESAINLNVKIVTKYYDTGRAPMLSPNSFVANKIYHIVGVSYIHTTLLSEPYCITFVAPGKLDHIQTNGIAS